MRHTLSALFGWKQTLLMFIHYMPIWATSKDCPVGTFNRVALFPSLSTWVTVALLWPSLLHLSPCQDSSFIYRKAFTQINTAPLQLACTHSQIHVNSTCTHTLQILACDQRKNKTRLFWARLLVRFLSFCQLFSLYTPSSFFFHLIPDCFTFILNIPLDLSVCSREKAVA